MTNRIYKLGLTIAFTVIAFNLFAYPKEVQVALRKAGKNRIELEKAITFCQKSRDPLKLKAIYFLIANMDLHYSMNYYWADANGRKIPFNELQYPDFNAALKAFDRIRSKTPGIHPVPYRSNDLENIKASFLITEVEQAFELWKRPQARQLSFNDFCEYLLPYRADIEPVQEWRSTYTKKFASLYEAIKNESISDALHLIVADQKKWFTNTWEVEQRKEPLPRLGAMQLLLRKKGNCDDLADLQVFLLRSQGYGTTIDCVPYWATASGTHFFNVTFDSHMRMVPFDVATRGVKIDTFEREPSKVVRTTFSRQQDALANFAPQDEIPPGFLRMLNYKDVTKDYCPVINLNAPLLRKEDKKFAYACVFNYLTWKPTWWGKVKNSTATFYSMPKGVVYLPAYYERNKIQPAGYPVAVGYNHQAILKPDLAHRHIVTLDEQEKYLHFQAGKNYTLFYWDNAWKTVGQQRALAGTSRLMFVNVPRNALLLLLPEYSKHLERPFIIDNNDKRIWF